MRHEDLEALLITYLVWPEGHGGYDPHNGVPSVVHAETPHEAALKGADWTTFFYEKVVVHQADNGQQWVMERLWIEVDPTPDIPRYEPTDKEHDYDDFFEDPEDDPL